MPRENGPLVDTISDKSIQQEDIEPVSHLEDILRQDDAVQNFGMTTFQARRLQDEKTSSIKEREGTTASAKRPRI